MLTNKLLDLIAEVVFPGAERTEDKDLRGS